MPTTTNINNHTCKEAIRIIHKLRNRGWSQESLMRMFRIAEVRLSKVLNNEIERWPIRVPLKTVLSFEYLPELRNAELHYISQLLTFGYTYSEIAEATNTPIFITTGRDCRETPDYQAIATLLKLLDGRAELISSNPNCVVEHCRAHGEWVNIAQGTFCPVHAERAMRVLGATREGAIAA